MNKKFFVYVLSLSLACSCASTPVFAHSNDNDAAVSITTERSGSGSSSSTGYTISAVDLDKSVEKLRSTVKKVLKSGDYSTDYDEDEYTNIILAIIQGMKDSPDAELYYEWNAGISDDTESKKYIKSIADDFFEALEAHNSVKGYSADIYDADKELASCIQGVLLGADYSSDTMKYSASSAEDWYYEKNPVNKEDVDADDDSETKTAEENNEETSAGQKNKDTKENAVETKEESSEEESSGTETAEKESKKTKETSVSVESDPEETEDTSVIPDFKFAKKVLSHYEVSLVDGICEEVNDAVVWMEEIAADNSHGYSQSHRLGPNYDCSSFVYTAFKKAGILKCGVGSTSTIVHDLKKAGFKDVTSSVNLKTGDGLRRGDVLWRNGHVEVYMGDGLRIGAHSDLDGKSGDSSGKEICARKYSNRRWKRVLRYAG